MIRKSAAFIALLLIFASCGKRQDPIVSDSASENAPKTRHAVRPANSKTGGRTQLRDAYENAKTMEPGEVRDKTIAELAWKSLETAPDMAAEMIRDLSPGAGEKEALMEAYIRKLLEEEKSDEALAWADSLGDEQDIAAARGKVLIMLAEKYPEQATQLMSVSDFTADSVNPVTEEVLQTWVLKSPADALAWTTLLPAGEARTTGYRIAFSQWFDTDTKSALAWIASQRNPSVRQEAVSAIIGLFVAQPDSVREGFLESTDPNLRALIEQGIAETVRQNETVQPAPEPEEPAPGFETELQLPD